jgi:hypothetical protein
VLTRFEKRRAKVGLDALSIAINALMTGYLADACPCRFPRFRATVGRDTSKVFAVSVYVSPEQQRLIARFDALVTLADRSPVQWGWRGRCTRCEADVVREDVEFDVGPARHLFITPRTAVDVGAPHQGAIPHVHDFFPLDRVPPSQSVLGQLAAAHPRMDEKRWLSWMSEHAPRPASRPRDDGAS